MREASYRTALALYDAKERGKNVLTMIAFGRTKRLGCSVLCWAFHAVWRTFSRASVHGAIPTQQTRSWRTVSRPALRYRVRVSSLNEENGERRG